MNSMTRLAFLIVLILIVTPIIVVHKSHSVAAQDIPLLDFFNPDLDFGLCWCIDTANPADPDFGINPARAKCDEMGNDAGCAASFLSPNTTVINFVCEIFFEHQCWQCFGVRCD